MTAINSQGGDVQLHTPKAPTVGPCSDEQNGSAVAAPLQTVRMPLSDEQILKCFALCSGDNARNYMLTVGRAIEAAHGIATKGDTHAG